MRLTVKFVHGLSKTHTLYISTIIEWRGRYIVVGVVYIGFKITCYDKLLSGHSLQDKGFDLQSRRDI